jgi:putative NIF3 family GTP cyclohydrolase 1 type 2
MHEEVGNNAVLARLLGLREIAPFGRYKGVAIGCAGTLSRPLTVRGMSMILKNALGGECITLPFGEAKIQRVGIVSGGAGDCLQEAIERGLDCFITGEPYHPNHHAAVEAGINVIYCGHYHSETVGVKALGPLLEARFGVRTLFLDEPTLV